MVTRLPLHIFADTAAVSTGPTDAAAVAAPAGKTAPPAMRAATPAAIAMRRVARRRVVGLTGFASGGWGLLAVEGPPIQGTSCRYRVSYLGCGNPGPRSRPAGRAEVSRADDALGCGHARLHRGAAGVKAWNSSTLLRQRIVAVGGAV